MRHSIMFVIACLFSVTSHAAVYTVDSTADDGSVGTLRWAIQQHNVNIGTANTIEFDASLAQSTITIDFASNGPLDALLGGNLTISGTQAADLVIDANKNGPIFRAVNFSDALNLVDLELRNGVNSSGGGCLEVSKSQGTISVSRLSFIGCEAPEGTDLDAFGGAVRVVFPGDNGIINVSDSTFQDNRAYGVDSRLYGGALYIEGGGFLGGNELSHSISDTHFQGNQVVDNGAALAAKGGAVFVQRASFGVIFSTFIENSASTGFGGAIAYRGQGSEFSSISYNFLQRNSSASGGSAIAIGSVSINEQPNMTIVNNTIVDNATQDTTFSAGGAIYLREANLTMRNNTLIDNSNGVAVNPMDGPPAHLFYRPQTVTISAMSNNAFGATESGPACGTLNSQPPVTPGAAAYNLLPDNSCQFGGSGDVIDPAPLFLPAAYYSGGRVPTQPPYAGNPAVDGGNPNTPDNFDNASCWETDARNFLRPADGDGDGISRCDMGAHEWSEPAPSEVIFRGNFEADA